MHQFERKQFLPITIEKGWEFFSNPKNLQHMTPDYMGLIVTSGNEDERMYSGMIFTYVVKPVFSIPMSWVTEITHVNEPHFFVDEQRFGPYKFWHHQHHLKEVPGGVEVRDIVNYKLYGGPLGRLLNTLFVQKQLDSIFTFRAKRLQDLFG